MQTLKIATHNSITGEASHGFLSWLISPFAKCQSKTLKEQLNAGVRYFDIRVKLIDDEYKCAHGLWISDLSLIDALNIICTEKVFINVTYEGETAVSFVNDIISIASQYNNLTVCLINQKKPKWKTLKICNNVKCQDFFMHLDWHSWHTLLPIPWLWKKIYYNKASFNCDYFTFVDFL